MCSTLPRHFSVDTLAASIAWANISTARFDAAVTVIIGAADVTQDVEALSVAVKTQNTDLIGQAIGKVRHRACDAVVFCSFSFPPPPLTL